MKRFVTYLYEYKNQQKIKNTGHLRIDIRNQMVNIQVSIRHSELENETGTFYFIIRDEKVYGLPLERIFVKGGQYNGRITCMHSLRNVIGAGIRFDDGSYMASSWKDEEDEVIARGEFLADRLDAGQEKDIPLESSEKDEAGDSTAEECSGSVEQMEAAALSASMSEEGQAEEFHGSTDWMEPEIQYRKINLNEIHTLPSRHWHYSNNSFLIHGFWNYGYLVVKEEMETDKKKICLGIPGIFEQPEMVMAECFGFSEFETLPPEVVEAEIGQNCTVSGKEKNQQPKTGMFGCWFANL